MQVRCRNGEQKEVWAFTKSVRLKRYGRKRIAIVHERSALTDTPRFLITDALYGESGRIIETWSFRWAAEVFHEFSKQGTGLEAAQVRNEEAVKRHLRLSCLAQSMLQRAPTVASTSEQFAFAKGTITFGQRCRAITREVFFSVLALAKRLKARLPGVFIVMGGANCEATMGAETVRQFPFVDAVVSGEADTIAADLVERLILGQPIADIAGVLTRATADAALSAGRVPATSSVTDLDALPYPDYRDYFAQFAGTKLARVWQPSVFVETSRGCWWGERMHCTFCGLNGATMAYRSKSAPRALDELTHLAKAHPGSDIQVVDNILDLKYFKTLLPELARRRLDVSLFYETKSNLKKDQIRLLRDAGVTTIQPGIESFSDAILKLMKKGVSGLQNIQLLKWCKEIGVTPLWNFLIGFPGEAPDDYRRMSDLTPRVCHLPSPVTVSAIRLDRFSPNFTQSDSFGFTKVRPLPFYDFIYDVPEHARRNLAYYFAYEYKKPQEIAGYAEPLVKSVHAWRTTWRHAELVSVDLEDRLVVFDTRPRAAAPVSVLSGDDRALYLACDAITEAGQLEPSRAARLPALVARGLVLNDGGRHLSLGVPIGEYQPSRAAFRRLRPLLAAVDARDRPRVRRAFRVT